MATDRRDRITGLYNAALERASADRAAFLHEACAGDEALRLEIESLLRYEGLAAGLLEVPALEAVGALMSAPSTGLIGREFGSYQITSQLGVGGMGEVYRARDSKLGRDVAIKILPQHFTADPERRARFTREARLLATLNHPNIGAIYGLETIGGVSALILELVEGPTLADHIERGQLPIPEALTIARQIVDALDSAHQKGIVHRDLKPANIVLQRDANAAGVPTGSVRAKVLDFGLAKTIAVDVGDARSRAASFDGTADGRILGTPAYMSPEQARGHPVDKRTDVWAFGCVLFEMLAGRRAFDGGSVSDTLVAILGREPAWSDLPTDTPAAIRALLRRCLQKDPHERLRDIADSRLAIVDGDTAGIPASVATSQEGLPRGRRRAVRVMEIAAAFLVGALLAAGSFVWWQQRAAITRGDSLEFGVGPPPSTTFPFLNFSFAIAPDGKYLAMVAFAENTLALWVRSFESGALRRLPGTEAVRTPFWSPDSRRIAFFSGGKLKTVGVTGDALSEVCDATAAGSAGGTWNQNGIILFGPQSGPLVKVAATGGTPTPVTALNETDTSHRYPWFLPDGQHFLFLALGKGRPQLRLGSLTSTDSTPLGTIRSNAVYAAGHLLFVQGGLVAQRFNPQTRELSAVPFPLNDRMMLMNGRGAFSVSDTGLLGYSADQARAVATLTWMDRAGRPIEPVGEPDSYFDVALSPDDRRVAVSSAAPDGNVDIWVIDLLRRGSKQRLTTDEGFDFHPEWSRDGTRISFSSDRNGRPYRVFQRLSDASGSDVGLTEHAGGSTQSVWGPKDSLVLFTSGGDLWTQPVGDAQKPSVFVQTASIEGGPVFSPNGRWIAYNSGRTGRLEVYIRPFPSKDPEHKVSINGGKMPRWRTDNEIFFVALDGNLMSARFDAAANPPTTKIPEVLFGTPLANRPVWNRPYDVARDGQRFLIPVPRDPQEERLITVVTNWTARLPR